jgi:hypothetical protein
MFFFSSILSMEKKENLAKGLKLGPLGWGGGGNIITTTPFVFLEVYIVQKNN